MYALPPKLSLLALCCMSIIALAGCSFATPFQGPGFDPKNGVTSPRSGTVIVAITQADYQSQKDIRGTFWSHVERVEDSLSKQAGFIGHSKRRKLFGNRAWTMTVWRDQAALDAFVISARHVAAMSESGPDLVQARFVRLEVDVSEIPIAWDRAIQTLDNSGRTYQAAARNAHVD